jgi:hypothetical protein
MMKIETIVKTLEYPDEGGPREALEAAIARREEITPHLLDILEQAVSDFDRVVDDQAYMGHLYAFYLVAQFREERAYPLIVEFFSIPGEAPLEVTGNFVTEDLARVLASVSGGELGPMQSLVENASANEYVRAAGLRGMACLVVEEVVPREKIIDYFRSPFRGGLERTYSFAWDALVSNSTHLYPKELLPKIRQAFADGLVDERHIDLPWIEEIVAEGKEATLAWLHQDRHCHFISDTIRETKWWA